MVATIATFVLMMTTMDIGKETNVIPARNPGLEKDVTIKNFLFLF